MGDCLQMARQSRVCCVPKVVLYLLAAAVWICGAVACGDIASRCLGNAKADMDSDNAGDIKMWLWALVITLGIVLGILLAYFLFQRLCFINIHRIAQLEKPRLWAASRLRFWFFLIAFDGTSVLITEYFVKDVISYLIVGCADLAICTAPPLSFLVFFTEYRTFVEVSREFDEKVREREAFEEPLVVPHESQNPLAQSANLSMLESSIIPINQGSSSSGLGSKRPSSVYSPSSSFSSSAVSNSSTSSASQCSLS